jgi:hypothetical protein
VDCVGNIHIECKYCGAEYDHAAHHVVEKCSSSHLVSDIINDEFFYAVCPHCHRMTGVDHPVVYADIENDVFIAYFDSDIEFALAHNQITQWIEEFGVNLKHNFVRIVSSQNELREKLILLENNLDDRVIEVIKLWSLEKLRQEGRKQEFEEMRCGVMDDGSLNIDFVGDPAMHIGLRKGYYKMVADKLLPIINQLETPLEVSTEWAVEFINGECA